VSDGIDVETLAQKLDAFAQTLTPRERGVLRAALASAMGPWERAAARPAAEVLEPEEAALLAELLDDGRG
jgi:hypothetical protein